MSTTLFVRPARPTDTATLTRLMTDAFLAGAVADHLVPDLAQRQRIYPAYWSTMVTHAQRADTTAEVDVVGAVDAAAIWYPTPAGELPDLVPADYDQRLAALAGEHLPRFTALDEQLHEAFPRFDTPWAYLGFIGTLPTAQGRGLGSALLQRYHQRLDRDGIPAYLIASSGRSRELYLRQGYLDEGRPIQVANGVPMYPMLRAALSG